MEDLKDKKSLVIIIIIAIVIIIGIVGIVFSRQKPTEQEYLDKEYIIHYAYDNSDYDIDFKKDKVYVTTFNQVVCIQAPCDPIKTDGEVVNYKKEYKYLIDKLFEDKSEVIVYYDDLDEKSRELIHEIIKVKIKEVIGYKVVAKQEYSDIYERGYYVKEQKDGTQLVTIAMGKKNTGGYEINVLKVNINDDTALIYVEETSPSDKDVVTMALTAPYVQIQFDKPLTIAIVQNIDTGYEFEKIDGRW